MQKYNMLEGNDRIFSQSKSIIKEYDLSISVVSHQRED